MITDSFSVSNSIEPDGLQFSGISGPISLDRYDQWHNTGRVTRRRGVIDFTVSLLLFIIILKSFPVRSKLHATTTAWQQRVYTPLGGNLLCRNGRVYFFFLPSGQTRSSSEGRKQLRMSGGVRSGNEPKPFPTPAPCGRHVRTNDTKNEGEEENDSLCPLRVNLS